MVRKTYLKMVCCLQTDCFVCKAEGSRCLLWPRRRMFPRGYVFSHKDGQSQHLFQHILPHSVSQQRRIEAHLNVTKWVDIVHYVLWINLISVILSSFIGPAMNVPRLIPTYQWTPVEQADVSFSPNAVKGSNRKWAALWHLEHVTTNHWNSCRHHLYFNQWGVLSSLPQTKCYLLCQAKERLSRSEWPEETVLWISRSSQPACKKCQLYLPTGNWTSVKQGIV